MSTSRMSLWALADSEEVRIGWTYDVGQIERLSRAAYNSTGYYSAMEGVEFIMAEADRRHKTIVTEKDKDLARRDKQLEVSAKVALKLSFDNQRLLEALGEVEEYLDDRSDADYDETGFVPNTEMRLLAVVRAALNK